MLLAVFLALRSSDNWYSYIVGLYVQTPAWNCLVLPCPTLRFPRNWWYIYISTIYNRTLFYYPTLRFSKNWYQNWYFFRGQKKGEP